MTNGFLHLTDKSTSTGYTGNYNKFQVNGREEATKLHNKIPLTYHLCIDYVPLNISYIFLS